MRRLARLRTASGLLAQAHPQKPSIASNIRCLAAQSTSNSSTSRTFSTSQPRPLRSSRTQCQKEEAAIAEAAAETAPVDTYDPEPTFVLPPEPEWAPHADSVPDPNYKPATSLEDLQEVGGLEGWWEVEENWNGTKPAFTPFFAGSHKIWDPKLLEGIARRAVAEALVVREAVEQGVEVPKTWALGGKDAAVRAMTLKIEVDGEREAKVCSEAEAKMVLEDIIGRDDVAAPLNEQVEGSEQATGMDSAETAQVLETVGKQWKEIALTDLKFKFMVTKRIQQLSGHILTDHKYWGKGHVNSLVQTLIQRPRPTKLAEELKMKSELLDLPNVTVHDRRYTRVDKHKATGRWKVIVRELEKRDLPVLGDGKYGRSVERSWIMGGT
ncbi:uncharacterized protein PpBr36_10167 [Pyricularia pennisetigena]|uniref:uncharacterized protein n=1 Tax=Pyricularia pennisetigena TaxID=1578925 RepID=UPI00114D91F4|nr:uncharacterized protein PpBr36_10167 [Pyricularia pennisetigena]TLS21402.1 hypothetical protein PpBr36_10167 [Pyricularia pennisetigena]